MSEIMKRATQKPSDEELKRMQKAMQDKYSTK